MRRSLAFAVRLDRHEVIHQHARHGLAHDGPPHRWRAFFEVLDVTCHSEHFSSGAIDIELDIDGGHSEIVSVSAAKSKRGAPCSARPLGETRCEHKCCLSRTVTAASESR